MTLHSEQNNSYGQILKSTSIIGGSSVIVIFLRIVQAKLLAVLLGPSGVGLIGIYGSVTGLLGQITGMGIAGSGVRQIAEASGSEDRLKIARTILTLRRTALFVGAAGMLGMFLFRNPISRLTFGHTEHAYALGILSVTLFLGAVSGGQSALIQGMRRIGDLGRLNIFGAVFGTLFSIPLVYFWGERGIAPFLVVVSAMGILTSWWYARKIPFAKIPITWWEITSEARALLRLGLVFMASGLMTMGTMYCIRVIVVRQFGIDAVGLYQAASAIASLYVGFILSAMGADFYPRLTAVASDNSVCNRMVNEQTEVSFLLAVPGILATLTFAPYVIQIFYSDRFAPAMDILRWALLGILLRVASWPLGFILLAKGKGKIFFFTELSSNIVYISLVLVLLHYFGLPGAGMAFFGFYVFYWILIFAVVQRLSGFSLSLANRRLYAIITPSVAVVFLSIYILPNAWSTTVGIVTTFVIGCYCLNALRIALGPVKVQEIFTRLKSLFRLSLI